MTVRILSVFTALALAVLDGFSQGFVNLGFESANLPVLPPGQSDTALASDAIPGWTGLRNSTLVSSVIHNGLPLSPQICIFGPNYTPASQILDGQFTVELISSPFPPPNGPIFNMSIEQRGLIPINSQSLQFKAAGILESLRVFLNGVSLTLSPIITATNYTLFGADVSPYGGQTVDLRFTCFSTPTVGQFVYLDAIQFSPAAVPEPSTWALLGLASAFLCYFARYRRRQS